MEKEFVVGTEFKLNNIIYVVYNIDPVWINYYDKTNVDDKECFMPHSDNWYNAEILNPEQAEIMSRHRLKELRDRLSKEDTDDAYKLIYMWIKQEYISLSEFKILINAIIQIKTIK